jgi:hypothetical protein
MQKDDRTLNYHETRLKLTLAKPSIDYMLDQFMPRTDLHGNFPEAFSEGGINSQLKLV